MVEAKGSPFQVILSTNQRESVKDADYVTTQLRVGHMEARRLVTSISVCGMG
jgi:6-phospho-beta-glucosidase